ncbi:cupin domain-containing protein [Chitinophaga sp. RAB17]|uniref:cupin domain-containing protein n=1 Tax=Chitinophaga sp. RAB17 TaxID=3233049 RepID=UPI003F90FC4F
MTIKTVSFKYQLEKAAPRIGPGGITRGASVKEFPASTGIAGVSMWLEPGAMRELHWHPNAAEWQYYIQGNVEMGVFLAEGKFINDQFEAGDIGYVPMGAGHYIKNTGTDVLKVLIGFNNGQYEAIDLSMWLSGNPKDLLAGNFSVDTSQVDKFPQNDQFIIKGSGEK